jgi:hypothetical protein
MQVIEGLLVIFEYPRNAEKRTPFKRAIVGGGLGRGVVPRAIGSGDR